MAGEIENEQYVSWGDEEDEDFARIKMRLYGRNLLDFEVVRPPPRTDDVARRFRFFDHPYHAWRLTENGQKQYALMME